MVRQRLQRVQIDGNLGDYRCRRGQQNGNQDRQWAHGNDW
jgi:hypothetical protein